MTFETQKFENSTVQNFLTNALVLKRKSLKYRENHLRHHDDTQDEFQARREQEGDERPKRDAEGLTHLLAVQDFAHKRADQWPDEQADGHKKQTDDEPHGASPHGIFRAAAHLREPHRSDVIERRNDDRQDEHDGQCLVRDGAIGHKISHKKRGETDGRTRQGGHDGSDDANEREDEGDCDKDVK